MDTGLNRENILIEALPYIKRFHGSTIVIKFGGHIVIDEESIKNIIKDIILLKYVGMKPVIVHGGGPEITRVMNEMGIKPKSVDGLRITDEKTIEIARMVLIGNINTKIVSKIEKEGVKSIGLSGKDGKLFTARKKGKKKVEIEGEEKKIDLGYVGEIENVDPELIEIMTERSYIPVISPIAIGQTGISLNVNADSVAGRLAHELNARKLIMATNVDGVLKDPSDKSTLISELSIKESKSIIRDGTVEGGMIPKVKACINAVNKGVKKAHIINGEKNHSILLEIFTDEGIGTMIKKN
ncbi:MAG: Acetylglutamate kinase [Candidatus Methanohalarchaeum thermophilum]|uniref:Acetylglutamate kinase n=1 Tax=Methanohalarchaeum thermophilum TaxID=1903181 RepID=A0A1Q6DV04_METT1|nr:MAG: Acetylglutamate kinase [Candidatus Methanohalarchaeum thermophilum]